MDPITLTPIGVVRSPYQQPQDTPIQPGATHGVAGRVELEPQYAEGLADLDGFSHIVLVTYLHLAKFSGLRVTPFLDEQPRGLFATRAPARPNPIGLSLVRLERIAGTTLHILDVDLVDGTPVLDIKPYVPAFDQPEDFRIGWLTDRVARYREARDDGRFA